MRGVEAWWRLLRGLISPGFWVALLGLLGITDASSATVLINALTARLLPTVANGKPTDGPWRHPRSTRTPPSASAVKNPLIVVHVCRAPPLYLGIRLADAWVGRLRWRNPPVRVIVRPGLPAFASQSHLRIP